MSRTVGRRHIGLGEDVLVENGGRSVDPAKGSVGLVLKAFDLPGIPEERISAVIGVPAVV